jgi:hypothetical protein
LLRDRGEPDRLECSKRPPNLRIEPLPPTEVGARVGIVNAGALALGLAAALALGLTGCGGNSEVGMGALTVRDLENSSQPGHFTGTPVRVRARLGVTSTGCVTVTVDGVTRMPFWPAGTTVEDTGEPPGRYTVDVPSAPTLIATSADGDTFEASGVIDTEGRRFDADSAAQDGKVSSLLGFCAIGAAPIVFRDGSTFVGPIS